MAVKKNTNKRLNPFDEDLDPAVVAAIGSPGASDRQSATVYDRIAKVRKMTPAQKKKAQRDAARNRVGVDLSASVSSIVDVLADALQAPKSQVLAFLFMYGAQELLNGKINITWALTGSRSPRFMAQLKMPEQPAIEDIQAYAEEWKKAHSR